MYVHICVYIYIYTYIHIYIHVYINMYILYIHIHTNMCLQMIIRVLEELHDFTDENGVWTSDWILQVLPHCFLRPLLLFTFLSPLAPSVMRMQRQGLFSKLTHAGTRIRLSRARALSISVAFSRVL